MKNVDLDEPPHFLISYSWDALNVNENRCEIIIEEVTKMFESGVSAGATEKLPGCEKKLHAKTEALSYDMAGHARKCVERYCELLYKVSSPCLDDHQFKQEELESVGEIPQVCSQNCLEIFVLGTNLEDQTFCGLSTNLQEQSQNGLRHVTDDKQD